MFLQITDSNGGQVGLNPAYIVAYEYEPKSIRYKKGDGEVELVAMVCIRMAVPSCNDEDDDLMRVTLYGPEATDVAATIRKLVGFQNVTLSNITYTAGQLSAMIEDDQFSIDDDDEVVIHGPE